MTKQEALSKLITLVESRFYFNVMQENRLSKEADDLLYRMRELLSFKVTEVLTDSQNYWHKYKPVSEYSGWYNYLGISPIYGTLFSDDISDYGEDAKLVTFDEVEGLLRVLESEEESEQSSVETLSVSPAVQTKIGKAGVNLELGIVNRIITVEEAKELNRLLVEVLDQFTSELSIGDVVSDNEQELVVCGVNGKNIWCEGERGGQFFTKKRDDLFLINKFVD